MHRHEDRLAVGDMDRSFNGVSKCARQEPNWSALPNAPKFARDIGQWVLRFWNCQGPLPPSSSPLSVAFAMRAGVRREYARILISLRLQVDCACTQPNEAARDEDDPTECAVNELILRLHDLKPLLLWRLSGTLPFAADDFPTILQVFVFRPDAASRLYNPPPLVMQRSSPDYSLATRAHRQCRHFDCAERSVFSPPPVVVRDPGRTVLSHMHSSQTDFGAIARAQVTADNCVSRWTI